MFISISTDSDRNKWQSFVQKEKMDWAQYLDADHRITSLYGVRVFPTLLVIDADGVLVGGRYDASSVSFGIKKALKSVANTQASTQPAPAPKS